MSSLRIVFTVAFSTVLFVGIGIVIRPLLGECSRDLAFLALCMVGILGAAVGIISCAIVGPQDNKPAPLRPQKQMSQMDRDIMEAYASPTE